MSIGLDRPNLVEAARLDVEIFAGYLWPQLDEDEYVHVRMFEVSSRKIMSLWVSDLGAFDKTGKQVLAGDEGRVCSHLWEISQQYRLTHEIYVATCLRAGLSGQGDAVRHCWSIWLDLDFKLSYDAESRFGQLLELPHAPGLITATGHGLHVYWGYLEAVQGRNLRSATGTMLKLSRQLKADNTSDLARILRLPGTYNWKDPDDPFLVRVLHSSTARWSASEVEQAFGSDDGAGREQRLIEPYRVNGQVAGQVEPYANPGQNGDQGSDHGVPAVIRHGGINIRDWIIQQGLPEHGTTAYGETFTGRNDALFEYAVRRRDEGCPIWVTRNMVHSLNRHNSPPMEPEEVDQTLESVYSQPPRLWIAHGDLFPIGTVESAVDADESESEMVWHGETRAPQPVTWLWENYVPEGRLIMLEGEEGIGKGVLCALLAARYAGRGVFWATGEDDIDDDVAPRVSAAAKAAGLDEPAKRQILYHRTPVQFDSAGAVMKWLQDAVIPLMESGQLGLIILDPGRSNLKADPSGEGTYNDEATWRPALQALARLAKQLSCTVVFVHHWNKNSNVPLRNRTSGSAVFRQVVRHVITLAERSDKRFAFGVTKSNVAKKGFVYEYEVQAARIDEGEWPVFVPIEADSDEDKQLEVWISEAQVRIVDDDGDEQGHEAAQVIYDCLTSKLRLPAGSRLPDRNHLAALTGLSQHRIRAGLSFLSGTPWIKARRGASSQWLASPTPEENQNISSEIE